MKEGAMVQLPPSANVFLNVGYKIVILGVN